MAMRNNLPDVWRGEREIRSPLREMSRLQRRMERIFDEMLSDPFSGLMRSSRELMPLEESMEFAPACDVTETKFQYLVSFDLPGVKKDDVRIELHDNQLTVSGERKQEVKEEEQGRMSRERYYGAFRRSFTLPTKIEADKVQASYDNGVLQIAIPKTEVSAAKQIQIKEGKLTEPKSGKAA